MRLAMTWQLFSHIDALMVHKSLRYLVLAMQQSRISAVPLGQLVQLVLT
jgi:hypothetical protein